MILRTIMETIMARNYRVVPRCNQKNVLLDHQTLLSFIDVPNNRRFLPLIAILQMLKFQDTFQLVGETKPTKNVWLGKDMRTKRNLSTCKLTQITFTGQIKIKGRMKSADRLVSNLPLPLLLPRIQPPLLI